MCGGLRLKETGYQTHDARRVYLVLQVNGVFEVNLWDLLLTGQTSQIEGKVKRAVEDRAGRVVSPRRTTTNLTSNVTSDDSGGINFFSLDLSDHSDSKHWQLPPHVRLKKTSRHLLWCVCVCVCCGGSQVVCGGFDGVIQEAGLGEQLDGRLPSQAAGPQEGHLLLGAGAAVALGHLTHTNTHTLKFRHHCNNN